MRKQLTELIKELVAFKSTVDEPGEKRAVYEFVRDWFKKRGIRVDEYDHPESPALVATIPGNGKNPILFLGHLDVVPAADDMFEVKEDGDILRARGVSDDKGPVAGLMLLMEKLKDEKDIPEIRLALPTDEEMGSADGTERLYKMGIFDDVVAVVAPDGGSEEEVVIKEKGILHFDLESTGKAAHAARKWMGENAIDKVISSYEAVRDIFRDENQNAEGHWHATINIGQIKGGEAVNQVPEKAVAGIDIRYTDKWNPDELLAKIKEAIAGKAEMKNLMHGSYFASDEKDPLLNKYIVAMETIFGKSMTKTHMHGATDGRFFGGKGTPVWMHLPAGGDAHSEKEWLDIESMVKFVGGMEKFLKSI